jgi:hypothetical protein
MKSARFSRFAKLIADCDEQFNKETFILKLLPLGHNAALTIVWRRKLTVNGIETNEKGESENG